MRHLKSGRRLGADTSHRKALIRNLATSFIENGKIKTTLPKAKELRSTVEKLITLSKKARSAGSEVQALHFKRQSLKVIRTKKAFVNLFEEYGERYMDRNGGYTRIIKLPNRLGDNAPMAIIQLVGSEEVKESKTSIKEVSKDLKDE